MKPDQQSSVSLNRFVGDDEGEALPNDAVCALLEEIRKKQYVGREPPDIFTRSLEHARKFSTLNSEVKLTEIREYFLTRGFKPYEYSQLINLMPEDVINAKALIPSLNYKSDSEIEEGLNFIRDHQTF
ncbi:MAG: hypothetical protein EZS28_002110 [Streblomastix strix]|uniref:RNA polymerase Rpb4/RPC9 core domain-containing protein n=1 Tax=Streblomastix strix TaxID=222440 RepID=A0A5J4X747_9EUKA|nr:MAG: hypothetical protein EZS28_002110 [Streblomastix strix]